MYFDYHIDWLSITLPKGELPQDVFPIGKWHYTGAGHHGYKARYVEAVTNMVCETDSFDPEMGSHFSLSGSTLENVRRDWRRNDSGIVGRFLALHGKSSRLDLALDLHEAKVTPKALKRALQAGKAKSPSRVWRWIEGQNGQVAGSTIYVGSPDSDRQLRMYDKAAEMGIADQGAWVRLELELRRTRANGAFQSSARNGVPETIRGHMADYLQWGNREYREALSGGSADPKELPREDTDRQKWLLGQVSMALAQEMILDSAFIQRMIESARAEVERIKANER